MNKKQDARSLMLGLLLCFCVSCAGKTIMVPSHQILHEPPQGSAIVTFIRATQFGGLIDFGIWDGDQFIGVIEPHKFIQYIARPGEHIFLARAENWSYVKANLEAGKKYYILTNVGPGVLKARVYLIPVTKEQKGYTQSDINEWMGKFEPISVDPGQLENYRNSRITHIREAVARYQRGEVETLALGPDDHFQ
jgi:hypothetical protein